MWQPVLMINGFLISIIGLTMLIPAAYDFYSKSILWSPFLSSALVTLFFGLAMLLSNRMSIKNFTLQQGFLLTVLSWFSASLFGALPFLFYGVVPSFADAFFETVSGVSTTGATIFADIEILPRSILLWRSMLNGLGGIGIVIFAVAMLPFLGIGGMQIFQRENSDVNEKFMPKFSYIAKRIVIAYFVLTIICFAALYLVGMGFFDALNHALTTVSTGGLSTKNASIGYFNSVSIELVISLFMFLGALPMGFYVVIWQGKDLKSYQMSQIVTFFKVLCVYTLVLAACLVVHKQYDVWQALRFSSFNVISIVTSTGFVSTDYMKWGNWVGIFFIIFALTGGCTGSTSGSIKILRWQVIFSFIKRALLLSTEPNRVAPLKVGATPIDVSIVSSVFVLFGAFMLSIALLSSVLAFAGYNLEIAFSSVVACITNSGPGLGAVIGPAGNYSSLSDFAKYVLSFTMLLGRLEIITVIAVFTRSFWFKN